MSNNKMISSVKWLFLELNTIYEDEVYDSPSQRAVTLFNQFKRAKMMEQEQAELYAQFVLKCVESNLPPIKFKDWLKIDENDNL